MKFRKNLSRTMWWKFSILVNSILLIISLSACTPATPAPATAIPFAPTATLAPTPTAAPAPTATRLAPKAEIACAFREGVPTTTRLADRPESKLFPFGITSVPQKFDRVSPNGVKISAALIRVASLDPEFANPNKILICLATYNGDLSPVILVVDQPTATLKFYFYDSALENFISVYDQSVTGSNIPLGLDKTIAAPLSVELARVNDQPVGGFDFLTYLNPETGALLAILDLKTRQFVHGQDLVAYETKLSRLPYVGDLPDTFPQQLQAMYKNMPPEKIISYWKFVRFPAQGDGWQPVAVATDGKEIKPMSDKLWQAVQKKMAEAAKLQINGNGEGLAVVNFVWNNNPSSPQYAVYAESGSNGEKTIAFFLPENQKPLQVKVPKDAKNFSWNFEHKQATYQSKNNTTFYYDESSAKWYNVAGFHPKPISAENVAERLNGWKPNIINESSTKYFAYGAKYSTNSFPSDPKPMGFVGDNLKYVLVGQFIQESVRTQLPEVLKANKNNQYVEEAAMALLAMNIKLTDSAPATIMADGITWSNSMRFGYDQPSNTLLVNPKSLDVYVVSFGKGYTFGLSYNIPPELVYNLMVMAYTAKLTMAMDNPTIECPISAVNVQYPLAYLHLNALEEQLLATYNTGGDEKTTSRNNRISAPIMYADRLKIYNACIVVK